MTSACRYLTRIIGSSSQSIILSRCLYVEDTGDECTKIAQSWKTKKEEAPKETEEPADGIMKLINCG